MRTWSPARSFSPMQRVAELADALLVGAADDQRAVAALEHLLEHDDLARRRRAPRASTTLSDSLSTTSWPRTISSTSTSGCTETRILRPGGEDVDGAVVVGAEEGAVRRRRHRELLDLFAERGDVLARLAQGGREAFVLRDGLGELALGLEDPLLERAHALGGVLEAAAEDDDLFLEGLQLALELADLPLVLGQLPVVLGSHADHLLASSVDCPRRRDTAPATLHRHLRPTR